VRKHCASEIKCWQEYWLGHRIGLQFGFHVIAVE